MSRLWGIETCARCGTTIMLGERGVRLRRGERTAIVCPECLDPAPPVPTWVAAPRRLSSIPVRIGQADGEVTRAA